jgi:predicted Zn finger-like uncharacterized protein
MLIVCPNCATSYMIDPASVGPAGRSVRCARCKSTWFATSKSPAALPEVSAPDVSAFVDGVIAEAEAETNAARAEAPPSAGKATADADDFGAEQLSHLQPQDGSAATHADVAGHGGGAGVPQPDRPLAEQDAVAVEDAPSLVPAIGHEPLVGHSEPEVDGGEEAESFAARRQRMKERRQKSKRTSRWTAVILVLFAFNVALIGARSEVVRYLPQTASMFSAIGLPVNLRNLKFDKVKITKETNDGVSILVIDGLIVNTANKPTEVPRLRFAARNATGQDVYTWTSPPARTLLGPNESMEFHSRLAAPPADARDVMVRFFTAQDAATGAR